MGGMLYKQVITDLKEELDQIDDDANRKMINKGMKHQTEMKQSEEEDEDYTPARDPSIDINQEVEDRKLAEKIGKYLSEIKKIKDDDDDDSDYVPENDEFNYAEDAEADNLFLEDEENKSLLKNSAVKRKRK